MHHSLSLDDVARYPRPGTSTPRRVAFTPDGAAVAYLFSADGSLVQELWAYDIATGERRPRTQGAGEESESVLSLDEQLRRERGRVRELGVTDYQMARTAAGETVLLVSRGGALAIARGYEAPRALPETAAAVEARLSPDGLALAFVRDGELQVLDPWGDSPVRRLTSGAEPGKTNGLAEYVAQEEMGRAEGYWWSPDSRRLAFVEADSRHIPQYPIVHQGQATPLVEEHRYPFAGAHNTLVRLGVVEQEGGEPRWMDLGPDPDIYLARVAWRPDGALTAQIESRDQHSLCLVVFDEQTGEATTLIEEHGEPWLNLADDVRYLRCGEILWSSEETGFRHLYVHDAAGRRLRALTAGEWVVTGVAGLDEERRLVYFHGTRDGVLERHLYAVSLDGGETRRVTEGRGWHEAALSGDGQRYVDRYSTLATAPALTVRRLSDGAAEGLLHAAATTAQEAGLHLPELTSLAAADGTTLHAAVYAPAGAASSGRRYPLIVAVYGGPHVQTVADRWDLTVDLRAQYLAQQGFVVLKVDNRGSANRGLAFEATLAGDMGHWEVEDQVAGVRFLAARPYVDAERTGIYGWSYGGYMTCQALMRAPDIFKVGVAGAPVTHWDGYDTHYTERYMGHPEANERGYRQSAVLSHVGGLRGRLLLVHGMVDENVHLRHTARLIKALIEAGKEFDFLPFPEERHMPRDRAGLLYLETRLTGYLRRHL